MIFYKGLQVILLSCQISFTIFSQEYNKNLKKENIDLLATIAIEEYETLEKHEKMYTLLDFIDKNGIVIKNKCTQAKIKTIRGLISIISNKFDVSSSFLNNVISAPNSCNVNYLKIIAHNGLGVVSTFNNDLFNAQKHYLNAIKIFKNNKDENIEKYLIDIYFSLAQINFEMKKWRESIKYSKKCIRAIKENNEKIIRLNPAYLALSKSYLNLNEIEKAKEYIDKFSIENDLDIYSQKNYYTIYSKIFLANNELEKSRLYLEKALKKTDEYINFRRQKFNMLANEDEKLKAIIKNKKNLILKTQKIIIGIIVLFLILSLIYLIKYRRLSNKCKSNSQKIVGLHHELELTVEDLKKKNIELGEVNNKISKLLDLNERTLFSKVFKLSTYNDVVNTLVKNITTLIEKNENIKPNKILFIEKTLRSMINENDIWEDFKIQFEKTRPDFYKKLNRISDDLTINDLKHCSYIVARLKTKDVANLINISTRSVETAKYRIKKKLGINKNASLFTFLNNL